MASTSSARAASAIAPPDDPIVFSGQPGASHDHSFVGNRDDERLVDAPLPARRPGRRATAPGDTAAYWMPTLYVDGATGAAAAARQIYYRRKTMTPVQAFPPGFRDDRRRREARRPHRSRASRSGTAAPERNRSRRAPCRRVPTRARARSGCTSPSRAAGTGSNLDSADHQSHVAYPVRGRCPSTHPVRAAGDLADLPLPDDGRPRPTLASGGQFSGHADFFNAWNQNELQRLVDACLNALRHCARR